MIHRVVRAARTAMLSLLLLPASTFAVGEPVNGFPNWAERVTLEWINRARVDPQVEMTACGSACGESACYQPTGPLSWNLALNRSARFHADEQLRQGYFAHASACTVVSTINSIYPTPCDASASCACVGGVKACSPTCTTFDQRIALFGGTAFGEIIATPTDPNVAFYLWLFEPYGSTSCGFTTANGHRWLIFEATSAAGAGVSGPATVDFGYGAAPTKIPSGSHYPRQAAAVDVWANWYDASAPTQALVDVDGTCVPMTLGRGTAANGAYHATLTNVGSGCHRYFFSFIDAGGNVVEYPTTGTLGIGPQGSCADWDSTRPAACTGVPPTPTASPTASRTPSAAPTPTGSSTPSRTPSATRTATTTMTPTRSATRTASATPTATASFTATATSTRSATRSASPTVTSSPTPTQSASAVPTPTQTPSGPPLVILTYSAGLRGGVACLSAVLDTLGNAVGSTHNEVRYDAARLGWGTCTINPVIGTGSVPDKYAATASMDSGLQRVDVGGTTATAIPDGALYVCPLRIDPSAPLGPTALSATTEVFDTTGDMFPTPAPANGQLTVTDCPGDCNGDGVVSIGELTRCISAFLGSPLCNAANPAASCPVADADHNGSVSIGEVTICTNRFLGGC